MFGINEQEIAAAHDAIDVFQRLEFCYLNQLSKDKSHWSHTHRIKCGSALSILSKSLAKEFCEMQQNTIVQK